MIVLQANYAFDARLRDADELLAQYSTLTGWSEALLDAGASAVIVQQRFHRRAVVHRNGVTYHFATSTLAPPDGAERVDLAHVNGLGFPLRTGWLRRSMRPPAALVVQDHAGGPPPANRLSRLMTKGGLRAVDAFLFTAAEQAAPWRAAHTFGRQPVYEVIESSTRVEPLGRAAARAASGIAGAPALLWVGRLNANKDPLTVLAGFERVVAALPRATLTMVFGTDELLSAVRARIAASPALAASVRLAGRVRHDQLPAYYSAADIFVLGSHHEGSGYALLEACACGTVPVVTNIPAFRAITGAGAVGALWAPGDSDHLARAVCQVAGSDLESSRAALAAHFARTLSWSALGRRAMEIYRDVRARRRSSLRGPP